MNKKLNFLTLCLVLCTLYSSAQNTWARVSTPQNHLKTVYVINDTLFGNMQIDSTLTICRWEDELWKPYKPIQLKTNEVCIKVVRLKGYLYALTTSRLLRLTNNTWQLIYESAYFDMEVYNNKLVIHGPFNVFMGKQALALAVWDGNDGGPLKTLNGQEATLTGNVSSMKVIGNKLYFVGNISNSQQGPLLSNTAVWNDTNWTQAFAPLNSTLPVLDVAEWNGELYFQLPKTPTNSIGIYKLVGNALVDVVPLDIGVSLFSTASNMTVYNNILYTTVMHNEPSPPGSPQNKRYTLLYYDGLKWRDSGDTLKAPSQMTWVKEPLCVFNGELYANLLPMNKGVPYVGKLVTGDAQASLAVIDTRDTSCEAQTVYRYLPALVEVENNGSSSYYYSSRLGEVGIRLPQNAVSTVTVKTALPYYNAAFCSADTLVINTANNTNSTVHFYKIPPAPVYDVAVSLTAQTGWRARHGFFDTYYVVATNVGTDTLLNVDLELNYAQQVNYHSSTIPPANSGAGFVQFQLPVLAPGQLVTIPLKLHNTTSLPLGDTVSYTAHAHVAGDANLSNNYDTLMQQVVSAYDPNNKLVNREGVAEWGGELLYQINFQNLGNDTAYQVVIVDTLPSDLHTETFKLLASSHLVDVDMRDKLLRFTFNNIRLPDSAANPEGSKGFVKFVIAMADNLADNDTVQNRAHIFFDFQPAVITNFAKTHKVVPPLPPIPVEPSLRWQIYPIPSTGVFKVNTEVNRSFDIYTYSGQSVYSGRFVGQEAEQILDLSAFKAGIYYLVEEFGSVRKLVIQR